MGSSTGSQLEMDPFPGTKRGSRFSQDGDATHVTSGLGLGNTSSLWGGPRVESAAQHHTLSPAGGSEFRNRKVLPATEKAKQERRGGRELLTRNKMYYKTIAKQCGMEVKKQIDQ